MLPAIYSACKCKDIMVNVHNTHMDNTTSHQQLWNFQRSQRPKCFGDILK